MGSVQHTPKYTDESLASLVKKIKVWGRQLGFHHIGITDTDLSTAEPFLLNWLNNHYHGEMKWMARHGTKRSRPQDLIPDTLRIISARMDYLPPAAAEANAVLQSPKTAYISRYALGRDYHKVLRRRLQRLADHIQDEIGPFGYRAFVDSAPVLEKALAEKAGLGWIGKHSNLLHQTSGSWFFLGELYTDLPLPVDSPGENHCGSCQACLEVCPTRAIVAPYQVDARRCISYLTIELRGSIPEAFRPLMGNRIYGCDDCQLVCPWNRFSQLSQENDFKPRHHLDALELIELFQWDEATFLHKTAGSAIRRIGYECWLRNLAVALGNAPADPAIVRALQNREHTDSELVKEHVQWALQQQRKKPRHPMSHNITRSKEA